MKIPVESLNLMTLNVGYARHYADWNWQGVSSPFTRIFFVTEGHARLHLPQGVVELRPQHAYIVPAHTMHSYECDGEFALYYLHVYEGFKNTTYVFEAYEFPTEVEVDAVIAELFASICRLHPDAGLPGSDPTTYDTHLRFASYVSKYHALPLHEKMELRGFSLMLLSRFLAKAQPKLWTTDERVQATVRYIHQHLHEPIDIGELAKMVCVSRHYLIRLFTATLGVPLLQYISRKKMEQAQLLLLTEELPVKELAYRLGYTDHSYFIRLFKKHLGITPQEYRLRGYIRK